MQCVAVVEVLAFHCLILCKIKDGFCRQRENCGIKFYADDICRFISNFSCPFHEIFVGEQPLWVCCGGADVIALLKWDLLWKWEEVLRRCAPFIFLRWSWWWTAATPPVGPRAADASKPLAAHERAAGCVRRPSLVTADFCCVRLRGSSSSSVPWKRCDERPANLRTSLCSLVAVRLKDSRQLVTHKSPQPTPFWGDVNHFVDLLSFKSVSNFFKTWMASILISYLASSN